MWSTRSVERNRLIAKDAWRIVMVFYENERFVPAGFLHASCALKYVEVEAGQLLSRVRRFSPGLGEADLADLEAQLQAAGGSPGT